MTVVRKTLLGCLVLPLTCAVLLALCRVVDLATSRVEPIDMQALLIDVSPFPHEWRRCIGPTQQPEHVHPERGALEFWFVGFCPTRSDRFEQGIDGAEHDVFEYGNLLEASVVFHVLFLRQEFSDRYTLSPWSVPTGWSYTSQVADRFRFACADIEPFEMGRVLTKCRIAAQYEEFVSVFGTTLDPSYMTLHDLERILVAIDERMALYLRKDTQ